MNEQELEQQEKENGAQNDQLQSKVSKDFLVKAGIISDETEGGRQDNESQHAGTLLPSPQDTGETLSSQTAQERDQLKEGGQPQRKVAKGYRRREQVEEIAKAAAVAAVEAINKSKPVSDSSQETKEQSQAENYEAQVLSRLTDDEKKLLDKFSIIESDNPEKYKNLRSNALKALDEYERLRSEWLKENPGHNPDEYDEDGSVMSSIENKYGIEVEEQDLLEAELKSQIAPIKSELEQTKRELEEAKAILAAERAKEEMAKAKENALEHVFQSIGITKEQAGELMGKETLASEAIKREAEAVANFVEAAYMSFAGLRHPLTNQVAELCLQYESAISSMPLEEQKDSSGRTFINRSAYLQLPMHERMMIDNNTHPKYWGLNADLASAIGANIIAERARKNYQSAVEKETRLLQEHGVRTTPNYPAMRNNQASQQQARPSNTHHSQARRAPSPTSVNPIPGTTPSQQNADIPQGFMQRFLGREPLGGGVTYEPSK